MTKLKKSSKDIANYCKLQIIFKNEARLGNNFHFKDGISKDLISDVIYKFHSGNSPMNAIMVNVRDTSSKNY